MCGQENPCFSFVWLCGVWIRGSLQADSLLSSHNSDLCSVGLCCGQDSRGFLAVFSQLKYLAKCVQCVALTQGSLQEDSLLPSHNSCCCSSLRRRGALTLPLLGNGSNAKVASALICAQIPSKATRHPFKTAAQGIEVTSVKNILCGRREIV